MKNYTTILDLRREISDQIAGYDMTCYSISYDDMLDIMTSRLWQLYKDLGYITDDRWDQVLQSNY